MPLLVLILTLAFGLSPLLVPDFGGFDPDQFPIPQSDPPVQPAGYAFAIWGLIYVWLAVGAGFGLWKRRDDPDWTPVRRPLALSMATGAVWLPVALQSPVWATILIWVMLATSLWALWRVPVADKWAAAWPIGLYAGWLSAASCVAIGLLLAGYGWTGQIAAALGMISLAVVLAALVQMRLNGVPTYGCAVIWALFAIAVQNGFALGSPATAALVGVAVMAFAILRSSTGK